MGSLSDPFGQRLGASQEKLPREKLILSLPDAFMVVAAINVPLGRAFVEKKKKKKPAGYLDGTSG